MVSLGYLGHRLDALVACLVGVPRVGFACEAYIEDTHHFADLIITHIIHQVGDSVHIIFLRLGEILDGRSDHLHKLLIIIRQINPRLLVATIHFLLLLPEQLLLLLLGEGLLFLARLLLLFPLGSQPLSRLAQLGSALLLLLLLRLLLGVLVRFDDRIEPREHALILEYRDDWLPQPNGLEDRCGDRLALGNVSYSCLGGDKRGGHEGKHEREEDVQQLLARTGVGRRAWNLLLGRKARK
mmetsp:Transcript_30392/g.61052  ORF Transcript_30392/g.61052 Transcript_30392/m.61052 type:complete len:240 (+) Transcript_30392:823-1542(+)